MATTSNIPNSTAAATTTTATSTATRSFPATATAAKSPSRPQTSHLSPFSVYHFYTSQNIPIRPQTKTQTPNPNSSSQQQQQQGILYPVASSGRGFMPRPVRPPDQTVTVANNPNLTPGAYHPRTVGLAYRPAIGSGSPRSHPHLDSGLAHHTLPAYHHPVHMIRQHPTHLQTQQQQHYASATGGAGLAPIKGIPVTGQLKAASAPSPVSDSNGYKNLRERGRDDMLALIWGRKVKISDEASLYSLCRSWLRNGFPEESQPHYGDVVKSLPRPLPMPVIGTHSPKKEDEEEEVEEDEEDEASVDHLSAQDLLKRHIKRAKKVRARLREGRLKRIARYKTRLALLLPPQVEQFRNETTAGN